MKKSSLLFLLTFIFYSIIYPQIGGYALKFDGTNDYVSVPDASQINFGTSTNFTIEAWIKLNGSVPNYAGIVVKGKLYTETGEWYGYQFVVTDQKIAGEIKSPTGFLGTFNGLIGTSSLLDYKWHHVAMVVDRSSTNAKLYVDGKKEADVTNADAIGGNLDNDATLYMGTERNQNAFINGFIDEVRVWNAVRTEAELKTNMYKELAGTETGLVAYYKMAEGTGTTIDDASPNSNTGSWTTDNGPTWKPSGCFAGSRQALDFDGTDDYVNLPTGFSSAFNGLQHFSFTGWVYPTFLSNNLWGTFFTRYSTSPATRVTFHQLPDGYGGNSDDILISINNDTYGEAYTTSNVLELNKWVHLAVVYDGTQSTNELKMKIYINGKLVNLTFPGGTNFPASISSTNEFAYFGRYSNPDYFKGGRFDEFSFWNVSLTESQIHEIMFRNLVGNESGLFAYYRFDQTDGTTLYDMTSNGYNGTLTNMDPATDWVSDSPFNNMWIGGESNAWSDAANWTGGVPATTDNIGLYKWTLTNVTTYDVSNSSSFTTNNLFISSTSTPTLPTTFTVNGSFIIQKDIDITGKTITLGPSGYLTEGSNRLFGPSGIIRIEKSWGTLSNLNAGGLGLVISSTYDFGWRTIIRGHTEQTKNGNKSILRYYKIIEEAKMNPILHSTDMTKGGGEVEFTFNYLHSELNELTENTITLFSTTDNGTNWTYRGGNLNTTNNTVTLSGITDDLRGTIWTLGSSASPLPVELASFSANINKQNVVTLTWQTATEVNNYGFDIERASTSLSTLSSTFEGQGTNEKTWENLGFIKGNSNSNSLKTYTFTDNTPPAGKVQYRLKQIDNDGSYKYSESVEVNVGIPSTTELHQNYPNPFNPTTSIKFSLSKDTRVKIIVYDILGNVVNELVNENKPAGSHIVYWNSNDTKGNKVSSGVYFYKLETGDPSASSGQAIQIKKMNLVK